jgi:hypothetical protein
MHNDVAAILVKFGVDPTDFKPHESAADLVSGQVPGEIATELWMALRALHGTTGVWPVIRGVDSDFETFDVPEDTEAMPEGDFELLMHEPIAELKKVYPDLLGNGTVKVSIEELAARSDQDASADGYEFTDVEYEAGSSDEIDPEPVFLTVHNADADQPVDSVWLSLVPVAHCWQAIHRLGFGGYNECPSPAVLAAVFRHWHTAYGAEPAVITGAVIECFVTRPPQTEDHAWKLAAEQWLVCDDIVSQGTESVRNLAKGLRLSPTWYFWWD